MINYIKKHYMQVIIVAAAALLMVWAGGCPPRTRSPIDKTRSLTRPELLAEMEYTIRLYEVADLDLQEQERIRRLILHNALLIAEAGTVNPLAILTMVAGAYGVTRVGADGVGAIKKRRKPTA